MTSNIVIGPTYDRLRQHSTIVLSFSYMYNIHHTSYRYSAGTVQKIHWRATIMFPKVELYSGLPLRLR
jgi:hypothetical protein